MLSSSPFIAVAVAAFAFTTAAVSSSGQVLSLRRNQKLLTSVDDIRFLPPRSATPALHPHDDPAPLDLLNIILLASVDGKFHALDRKTGKKLWSMAAHADASLPSYLAPLVSTQHPDHDPDYDDPPETYIIEPQSGDIYVTSSHSPDEPLQRLPFSMSQLVEMSPFSFGEADGGQDRVFVGRKKTSLLVLELQTGRVKAALDSECPWLDNPFDDLGQDAGAGEIDLDELDGSKEPKEYPVEIQVGRSDFTVSIRTLPLKPGPSGSQNLSFAAYGPNNQDQAAQLLYQRTPDDIYVEPLPNGEVIAFRIQQGDGEAQGEAEGRKAAAGGARTEALWGQRFPSQIVAVFDVVRTAHRRNPFVLLQPRPRLDDTVSFFELTSAARRKAIDASSAYVGIVEETGSLYALAPDHYSLVIFGGHGSSSGRKAIGSGPAESRVVDFDEVCKGAGYVDRRCATGLRQLREDSRSRLARLLDSAPHVPLPPPSTPAPPPASPLPPPSADDNGTLIKMLPTIIAGVVPAASGGLGGVLALGGKVEGGLLALVVCALVGIATFWLAKKRSHGNVSGNEKRPGTKAVDMGEGIPEVPMLVPTSARMEDVPSSSSSSPPTPPSPVMVLSPPARKSDSPRTPGLPDSPRTPGAKTPTPAQAPNADEEEGSEREAAGEVHGAAAGKRKGTRRKRGKRKKGGAAAKDAFVETEGEGEDSPVAVPPTPVPMSPSVIPVSPSAIVVAPTPVPPVVPSLTVSDSVLGFGSHGTVVYQGSLQGRAVAVKRLLNDFTTLALREVSLLQDADDHPNVIRYYYQESHANFLYIALELCPASLADVVERPHQFPELSAAFVAKRALREIASGLRHLHALKIVHRDIKPQNILVADAKKGHRMLISDFGLCRKLELDQTSFLPTTGGAMGVGTFGWRAPEILRGDVKLDDTPGDDASMSSRGSSSTATAGSSGGGTSGNRLTKSVDIFALGCLFYYCLTSGGHPFGDRFEREVNIMKNVQNLDGLEVYGEEGAEAADLIGRMLAPEAGDRPDTTTCLMHPYFWDAGRRLSFLQDASDRFENMCRDPRDAHLIALETGAHDVVGSDWAARLDRLFLDNLGKFRKYDGKSVQDLLRALRNKRHHYQDLPENVKRHVGSMPEGFLAYFTRRYPRLFLHVHRVISGSTLRTESMFRAYFSVPD